MATVRRAAVRSRLPAGARAAPAHARALSLNHASSSSSSSSPSASYPYLPSSSARPPPLSTSSPPTPSPAPNAAAPPAHTAFSPTPPPLFRPSPPAPSSPRDRPDPERPDAPVPDAEWEIRVGRGMLHLRETLPRMFDASLGSDDLFPREVFSPNVVLKLPHPFPIHIPGLTAYRMAFATGRSGLHALHTDLGTTLQRMTFSPPQPPNSLSDSFRDTPPQRHKQIRVLLALHGHPRLPPHHRAEWTTSNLYTFNPYSGLIASHEVETIRPLPGEGVGEWVMHRLLGWTRRNPSPATPAGGVGFVEIEEVR